MLQYFSGLDLILLVVVLYFVLKSFIKGFLREAFGIFILIAAFMVSVALHDNIAKWLITKGWLDHISRSTVFINIVSCVGIFIATYLISKLVINLFIDKASSTIGFLDRLFGCILGLAKSYLLISVFFTVINIFIPYNQQPSFLKKSVIRPLTNPLSKVLLSKLNSADYNSNHLVKSLVAPANTSGILNKK